MSESLRSPRTPTRRSRGRAATALIAAGGLLATTALTLLSGTASASSHREAPLIAETPNYDNTDTYAFVSPDDPDTVTFVSNWFGVQEPNGGPTYYPWANDARYEIKIDSNGDATPDVTYRYEFEEDRSLQQDTFLNNVGPVETLDDPNLLYRQFYKVTKITEHGEEVVAEGTAAPSIYGIAGFPNYDQLRQDATSELKGGGQTYVGGADDPFFIDLRVFDLLYGGDLSLRGQDTFAGYNVNTVVLQVPKDEVALKNDSKGNPVIGTWSTTEVQSIEYATGAKNSFGDFVQVSRLGNPLINEVVIPIGLKDAFNGISPDVDATIPEVVDRVLVPEVPQLVEAIYGIPAPATPRNDLFEIFLTGIAQDAPVPDGDNLGLDLNSQVLNEGVNPEDFVPSEMLRLNMSVPVEENPSRLGALEGDFQGFPNGRRLADDVVDIGLQTLQGAVRSGEIVPELAEGDLVNENDKEFSDNFPYVALPHQVNVNDPANTQISGVVGSGENSGSETTSSSGTSSQGGFLDDLFGGAFASGGSGSGPAAPMITGAAALVLLGAGATMMIRRRDDMVTPNAV